MISRFCAGVLACAVFCGPLRAQPVTPARFSITQPSSSHTVLSDAHAHARAQQQQQQGDDTPSWLKGALIGAGVGALGGWALSGTPCENASSNCRSKGSSILAGAGIGAVIGALITWHHD